VIVLAVGNYNRDMMMIICPVSDIVIDLNCFSLPLERLLCNGKMIKFYTVEQKMTS